MLFPSTNSKDTELKILPGLLPITLILFFLCQISYFNIEVLRLLSIEHWHL